MIGCRRNLIAWARVRNDGGVDWRFHFGSRKSCCQHRTVRIACANPMKLTSRLLWLLLLSFTVASAQEEPKDKDKDKGADKKSAAEKPEKEKEPILSVTEHELTVDGKVIKYRATAGYMLMKDAKNEKAKANIFFIAYTKLDDGANKVDPAKRPVTFSFNGGPGSASIWLHMGAIGPKRVVMTEKGESLPPPYKMMDNDATWLDQTDLVFIDPVSTGYSRAATGEDPKQFHGFNEDIASVGDFIRLYTTRYQRWA